MTTMIALVGEQPQPNFLPVLHYKPELVLLAYTERTQEKYEYLKTALEQRMFPVSGVGIDPYDILAAVKTLHEKLDEKTTVISQPLLFNLTGGTKTMSLAAYQVAEQRNASVMYLQSERGKTLIDHYDWLDHHLNHQRQERLPGSLQLHDVLDLHLGQGKDLNGKKRWEEKGPINDHKNYGHLFELAIAQALRDHDYEVMCGVKGKNDQVDIDVMVRYQNQIGVIEAKTSEHGQITKLDGIKQLSTAMRYIGSTYIRQFLVIDGEPSHDLKMMSDLLRVSIISLPQYKRGPDSLSLSQEDRETLLSTIDKTMKV